MENVKTLFKRRISEDMVAPRYAMKGIIEKEARSIFQTTNYKLRDIRMYVESTNGKEEIHEPL